MTAARLTLCSICNRQVDQVAMRPADQIDVSLEGLIAVNARNWEPGKQVCEECLARFARQHDELVKRFPHFDAQKLKVLPTPARLDAPEELRGTGVTIAFLDSGFYAHPDLTQPRNRIVEYVNLVGPTRQEDLAVPNVSSWHGMMTSVVAAGSGYLSGGLYGGIASDANLVLVKVGSAARIAHADITRGLRWVIQNQERLNIRIVNVSCGGDCERSYLRDPLCQAAEDATRAGLVVIAAAGNAGAGPDHPVLPPASAPSVITVGGLDDKNTIDLADNDIYNSSYGPTIDGLKKPEVIAPGIWVAAPILPGTETAEQAALLAELEAASDDELRRLIRRHPGVDPELDQAAELDTYLLRRFIWTKIRNNNVISANYKHVDGTSFAAPIVSSIAAQMIQVRPELHPHEVKLALIKTALRLPHVEEDRQGWGMVNPRGALSAAMNLAGKRESQAPPNCG